MKVSSVGVHWTHRDYSRLKTREWYQGHKEYKLAYYREYAKKNREKVNARHRKYRAANPEKAHAWDKTKRAKPDYREKKRRLAATWGKSVKGKKARRRYRAGTTGKLANNRYWHSEKGRLTRRIKEHRR